MIFPCHAGSNCQYGNPVSGAENRWYKTKIEFNDVGWKSKITQKRATFSISINKIVVIGSCLKKGQVLYSYLAKDKNNRSVIITYLDGEEMKKKDLNMVNDTIRRIKCLN